MAISARVRESGDQLRAVLQLDAKQSNLSHEFHEWEKASLSGLRVASSFTCGQIIGRGSFGTIRLGRDETRNGEGVAIKLEKVRHGCNPCLDKEFRILKRLQQAPTGFPRILALASVGPYRALVMQLLGPNLQVLFERCDKVLSVHCVAMIALQLLERFEYLHAQRILYRDVKGENFLIGSPGSPAQNTIYVVDFGLARDWREEQYEKKSPAGTPRYMSLRTHMAKQPSYRDDLESLTFLLIYFAKGKLPWQGIHDGSTMERIRRIGIKKGSIAPEELCEGLPQGFARMLRHSRSLTFDRQADFHELRTLFYRILHEQKPDYLPTNTKPPKRSFDWIEKGISLDVTYEPRKKETDSRKDLVPEEIRQEARQILNQIPLTHTRQNLSDLETPELLRRLTENPGDKFPMVAIQSEPENVEENANDKKPWGCFDFFRNLVSSTKSNQTITD